MATKTAKYLTKIEPSEFEKRKKKFGGMANYTNLCAYLDEAGVIVLLRELKEKKGEEGLAEVSKFLKRLMIKKD